MLHLLAYHQPSFHSGCGGWPSSRTQDLLQLGIVWLILSIESVKLGSQVSQVMVHSLVVESGDRLILTWPLAPQPSKAFAGLS